MQKHSLVSVGVVVFLLASPAVAAAENYFAIAGDAFGGGQLTEVTNLDVQPPQAIAGDLAKSSGAGIGLGDFDNDGDTDYAIVRNDPSDGSARRVEIHLRTGSGFTLGASITPAIMNGAFDVAVADFNKDGKLDLAITGFTYSFSGSPGSVLWVYRGNGNGTFTFVYNTLTAYGLNDAKALDVADINGDGFTDIVIARRGGFSNDRYIFTYVGNGAFGFANGGQTLPAFHDGVTDGLALADVDRDGKADLILTNSKPYTDPMLSTVLIYRGNGNATFQTAGYLSGGGGPIVGSWASLSASSVLYIDTDDIDGDGYPELMVAARDIGPTGAEPAWIMLFRGVSGGFASPNFERGGMSALIGGISMRAFGAAPPPSDVTAPTVALDALVAQTATPTMALSGTAVDGGSGVATVQFVIDGTTAVAATLGADGRFRATVTLAEGPHSIAMRATDHAGNSVTTAASTILVDTTGPTVSMNPLVTPTRDSTLQLTGRVQDPSGVISASFTFTRVWDPVTAFSFAAAILPDGTVHATASLPDENYVVRMQAFDNLRNSSATSPIPITIDTRGPAIGFAPSHLPGAVPAFTANGTLRAAAYGSDGGVGVANVFLYVNGILVGAVPYDGSLFDVVLAPGLNTLELRATDLLGNTSSATATTTFDAAGPTLVLASLPEFTNQSTTDVAGTATDDNGVATIAISVNGSPAGHPFAPAPDGSFRLLVGLAQGANTISVTATDVAGFSTTKTTSITVDSVPPTTSIGALPAITSDAKQTVVACAVDLGSHTAALSLTVLSGSASQSYGPFAPDPNGCIAVPVVLSEGKSTLAVDAVDGAGNHGGSSAEVIVDTAAPVLAIDQPTDGQVFGTGSVRFHVTVGDTSTTTVTFAGRNFTFAGGSGVAIADIDFPEGETSIEVIAFDAAGNVSRRRVRVIVDFTRPIADFDFGPDIMDGSLIGPRIGNLLPFTLHCDDDTELVVELPGDPDPVPLPPGGGTVQRTITLGEGTQPYCAKLTDAAGNTTEQCVTLTYDPSAPTGSFGGGWASWGFGGIRGGGGSGGGGGGGGGAGGGARGTIELSIDAADSITGVASVCFEIEDYFVDDGEEQCMPATRGPGDEWTYSLDTTLAPDCHPKVRVRIVDKVGNTTTLEKRIITDNTPPVVQIDAPAAGSYVRGTITITASAYDPVPPPEPDHVSPSSGVAAIDIYVNGIKIGTCVDAITCSVPFDTTTLANGPFVITALARDWVGNEAVPAQETVIADNTAPEKFLIQPLDGSIVSGSMTVAINITDDNFASVECFVDGVSIGVSTSRTASWDYSLATTLDGAVRVQCVARDLAGNVGTESATVTVRNCTLKFNPQAVNLDYKPVGDPHVKMTVTCPNATATLTPILSKNLTVVVPGGSPVPAIGGQVTGSGVMIYFDRKTFVARANAALASGAIDPKQPVTVRLLSGTREIGVDTTKVIP